MAFSLFYLSILRLYWFLCQKNGKKWTGGTESGHKSIRKSIYINVEIYTVYKETERSSRGALFHSVKPSGDVPNAIRSERRDSIFRNVAAIETANNALAKPPTNRPVKGNTHGHL